MERHRRRFNGRPGTRDGQVIEDLIPDYSKPATGRRIKDPRYTNARSRTWSGDCQSPRTSGCKPLRENAKSEGRE